MRIGEAAAGLRARRFSAVDLATAAISRIAPGSRHGGDRADGALGRGPQTHEPVLEQVVTRSKPHGLHRRVLADRSRNDDERDVQPALAQELQRPQAAELRHRIVRDDQVDLSVELP